MYAIDWSGERLSKLGNELDSVSTLSFVTMAWGIIIKKLGNGIKFAMLKPYNSDFHWWNFNMGVAHHYLGNTVKQMSILILLSLYTEKNL